MGSVGNAPRKSKGKPPFNPVPWVLAVVTIVVIFAVVLAIKTLTAPLSPRETTASPTSAPVAPTDPESESPEPEEPEEPETPGAKEPLKPIYIDSVEEVDPDGDGQHPEQQHLAIDGDPDTRSEEHTSELQSRGHLVCRL